MDAVGPQSAAARVAKRPEAARRRYERGLDIPALTTAPSLFDPDATPTHARGTWVYRALTASDPSRGAQFPSRSRGLATLQIRGEEAAARTADQHGIAVSMTPASGRHPLVYGAARGAQEAQPR